MTGETFQDRPTVEDILKREAQMLNQPVDYVNSWETFFKGTDGVDHVVTIVVYQCRPHEVVGSMIHQARAALYTDGKFSTGAVVGP